MPFWRPVKRAFGFPDDDDEDENLEIRISPPERAEKHVPYDLSLPTYAVNRDPKDDREATRQAPAPTPIQEEAISKPEMSELEVTPALSPVSPAVIPLEAEKAEEQHRELRDKLEEIILSIQALTTREDALAGMKEEMARLIHEKESIEAKCEMKLHSNANMREKLAGAREEIATLRRRLALMQEEKDKIPQVTREQETLLAQKDAIILSLEKEKEKLNSHIASLNREIGSLRKTVENSLSQEPVNATEPNETEPVHDKSKKKKKGRKKKMIKDTGLNPLITNTDQFRPAAPASDFGYHENTKPVVNDPNQLSLFID